MGKKGELIEVLADTVVANDETTLYLSLTDWLREMEWTFDSSEKKDFVGFSLRLKHGSARVGCYLYEESDWKRLTVCATYYTYVPELKRNAVSEALARINTSLLVGCFELDFGGGELRSRCWHQSEREITREMISHTVRRTVDLADKYQAALLAIAFGDASPATVIELADKYSGTVQ